MTDPQPEATVTIASQSIELALTGKPDVKNKWGAGSIRPVFVVFTYLPEGIRAHLYGVWVREDGEVTDAPCDQAYRIGDGDEWPDWMADLAREHKPADRAAEEAYRLSLSTALRLGTGANWEAIRDRAEDLVAEVEQLTEASRRLLEQRQDMAAERFAWQERGDQAEARVRQMEAAASADRAVVLRDAAELLAAHPGAIPYRPQLDEDGGFWWDTRDRDAAADLLRRMADETQRPEGEPTESVIYQVVGDWGVDSADTAEGARAAVAKWLRAYPKCGAFAQQRICRDWPDGSEFSGPWTDLPEQPTGT